MTEGARMLVRSVLFLALMVVVGVAGMAAYALVERELHPAVAAGPTAGEAPAASTAGGDHGAAATPRAFGNTQRGLIEFAKSLRPYMAADTAKANPPAGDVPAAARPAQP
ncbi:hypothetical protein [Desulfovibrio legallii]|uniref:Uncharacterized protein n=1 Tax=Desulfovibrio legallii TaxID=571438 RepID=A0A1G7IX16_9BACT|nr:hypothetical protein [Desulfovibrio legallii]SDF17227.1 hypothetical protein SAMN05192586_102104 [Desulfovibrio legallii]